MRIKLMVILLLMLIVGIILIFYVGCNAKTRVYTVSFNSNGGTPILPHANVLDGSMIDEPTIPFKTGHIFSGWYRETEFLTRWNFAYDTVNTNITLHAKWVQIFYGPAGGFVFYDKGFFSDDWRYLELAPTNSERTRIWGSISVNVQITKSGIGTGKYNTNEILRRYGYTGGDAARYCDTLVVTNGGESFNDWFLPSIDELNQIYYVLKMSDIDVFNDFYYWSSTENSRFSALVVDFRTGTTHNYTKDMTATVRAIRAF